VTGPSYHAGGPVNPLDSVARGVVHGAQDLIQNLKPRPTLPLTAEEKKEAEDAIKAGAICVFCASLHPGASSPACPRLASGKVNGDGKVTEFTFWQDGLWDNSRLVHVEDLDDDDDAEEAP
jgi:hypothetical protein